MNIKPESFYYKNLEDFFEPFFDALLKGSRTECKSILVKIQESGTEFTTIYESLFKKSLYKIGQLWEQNKIGVAVEHMSTLIIEDLMSSMLAEIISVNRQSKSIVVASIEKEEHQVGGKMVADLFENCGWDAFYLGANTPKHEILRFANEKNPDLIGLSLSVYTNLDNLIGELAFLRKHLSTSILIGGQALHHVGHDIALKFIQTYYVKDLGELKKYITKLE